MNLASCIVKEDGAFMQTLIVSCDSRLVMHGHVDLCEILALCVLAVDPQPSLLTNMCISFCLYLIS